MMMGKPVRSLIAPKIMSTKFYGSSVLSPSARIIAWRKLRPRPVKLVMELVRDCVKDELNKFKKIVN